MNTSGKRSAIQQRVTLSFQEQVPDVDLYVAATILPELAITPETNAVVVRPGESIIQQLRIDNFGTRNFDDVRVIARTRDAGTLQTPATTHGARPVAPQEGYREMCRQSWVTEIRFDSKRLLPGRNEYVIGVQCHSPNSEPSTSSVSWVVDVKPRLDVVPGSLLLDFSDSDELVRELRLFYWDESLVDEVPEVHLSPELPFDMSVRYLPRSGRMRVAQLRFTAPPAFAGSIRGKVHFQLPASPGETSTASVLALQQNDRGGTDE